MCIVRNSSRHWSHVNGAYSFGTMWNWNGKVDYRRQNRDLCTGDTFLFDPGEFFYATPFEDRPGSFRVVEIQVDTFEQLCQTEGLQGRPHFAHAMVRATPDLARALQTLERSLLDSADSLELQSRLAVVAHAAALSVIERTPKVRKASPLGPCERLRELLHDPDGARVNLCEFARESGVSQFQLLRAFKQRYGAPPHAYNLHVRLERARLMLRRGFTVAAAAAANDFTDQSHLTRHFRRVWRLPPGQYAAAR
jgi:AraC-like DNA-binding protein